MRTAIKTLFVLAAAGSFASVAAAQSAVSWLATGEGDFAPTELAAPLGHKATSLSQDAVAVSWAVPAEKALDLVETPFVATSKEYWIDVTGADLARGIELPTHGPGALLRINPVAGEKLATPLDPMALEVTTPAKALLEGNAAFATLVDSAQLEAAGAPFADGTIAGRLRSELGAGTFGVQLAGLAEDGRFVVHVLDHGSPLELAVRTDRANYLDGDTLVVRSSLAGTKARGAVEGFVVSPAGRAWPLVAERSRDGEFHFSLELDGAEAPAPGLWEAHLSYRGEVDGLRVRRYGKVAFAVAMPAGRLDGNAALTETPGQLAVTLGVETAADGRFEVRGVLFGSDAAGKLQPIAVGHSAAWLGAGAGSLELRFDQALVDASGLGAPFEVRDLRLLDQGNLALLQRQAHGLRIE